MAEQEQAPKYADRFTEALDGIEADRKDITDKIKAKQADRDKIDADLASLNEQLADIDRQVAKGFEYAAAKRGMGKASSTPTTGSDLLQAIPKGKGNAISAADLAQKIGGDKERLGHMLKLLTKGNKVTRIGKGRGTKYYRP